MKYPKDISKFVETAQNELSMILAVAVLIGAVSWSATQYGHNKTSTGAMPSKTPVLGAVVQNEGYSLSATKISTETDQTSQLQHVVVAVQINNTSGNVLEVSPGLQMFMRDQQGHMFPMTAQYLPAGSVIGGPLADDATFSQNIDFAIPASSTSSKFVFQRDASSKVTEVDL